MCDRDKTSRAGSQINFIEFVVAPLYAQVCRVIVRITQWLVCCGDCSRCRPMYLFESAIPSLLTVLPDWGEALLAW